MDDDLLGGGQDLGVAAGGPRRYAVFHHDVTFMRRRFGAYSPNNFRTGQAFMQRKAELFSDLTCVHFSLQRLKRRFSCSANNEEWSETMIRIAHAKTWRARPNFLTLGCEWMQYPVAIIQLRLQRGITAILALLAWYQAKTLILLFRRRISSPV